MPDKQDDPNEAEARRERVRWIRLVHLTLRISLADEEQDPLRRLLDDLGQSIMTGPMFDAIYHAIQMEMAIRNLVDQFDLNSDEVATVRDMIQRVIMRH